MKRGLLSFFCAIMLFALIGCSKPSSSAVQTRNDLSREHLMGLTSGMKRTDVIDLIGENDEALAGKEDFDVYTLADGTTAVLRYQGDVLRSAFIRDADNFEDALFNDFEKPAAETNTVNGNSATDNTNNNNATDKTNNTNNTTENTANTTNDNTGNTTNTTNDNTGNTTNTTNDNTGNTTNTTNDNTRNTTNTTNDNTNDKVNTNNTTNNTETINESNRTR